MLKKTIKVKGTGGRTSLVEFLVDKRVKYLEYVKDICSDEGELWMNSIHLNASDVAHYFRTAENAVASGAAAGVSAELTTRNPSFVDPNASFTTSGLSSAAVANARELHFPVDTSVVTNDSAIHLHASSTPSEAAVSVPASPGLKSASAEAAGGGDEFVTVSLASLPVVPQVSSPGEWYKRVLPAFSALALSLSDLLLAPITGEEFVECFYGLMLELEACFAGGTATKAMAQRAVKTFRQHLSESLLASLRNQNATDMSLLAGGARPGGQDFDQRSNPSASPTSPAAPAAMPPPTSPTRGPASPTNGSGSGSAGATSAAPPAIDVTVADGPLKYLFLRTDQLEYQAAPPACEAILPALCAVLIVAFRKLCDYDLMSKEESVKRILSIDKHVQKFFFKRINKEFERMACGRLVREAYLLSPSGFFAGIGESDASFLQDVVEVMKAHPSEKKKDSAGGAGDGEGEDLEDSDDSDD